MAIERSRMEEMMNEVRRQTAEEVLAKMNHQEEGNQVSCVSKFFFLQKLTLFFCVLELLELWPPRIGNVFWLQPSAILRIILSAKGLGHSFESVRRRRAGFDRFGRGR